MKYLLTFSPTTITRSLHKRIHELTRENNKYRKSYERECISGFMSTSDVLKVLKIARAVGECNLRTFKTSRVTINPEMHEQVHTIFYLSYIQQNYSFALLCTPYVPHQKHFNGFPNTHMFYLNQSKI